MLKIRVKMMQQAGLFCQNFIAATHNGHSVCMHVITDGPTISA